jgi:phospholipid N-methyltransferase
MSFSDDQFETPEKISQRSLICARLKEMKQKKLRILYIEHSGGATDMFLKELSNTTRLHAVNNDEEVVVKLRQKYATERETNRVYIHHDDIDSYIESKMMEEVFYDVIWLDYTRTILVAERNEAKCIANAVQKLRNNDSMLYVTYSTTRDRENQNVDVLECIINSLNLEDRSTRDYRAKRNRMIFYEIPKMDFIRPPNKVLEYVGKRLLIPIEDVNLSIPQKYLRVQFKDKLYFLAMGSYKKDLDDDIKTFVQFRWICGEWGTYPDPKEFVKLVTEDEKTKAGEKFMSEGMVDIDKLEEYLTNYNLYQKSKSRAQQLNMKDTLCMRNLNEMQSTGSMHLEKLKEFKKTADGTQNPGKTMYTLVNDLLNFSQENCSLQSSSASSSQSSTSTLTTACCIKEEQCSSSGVSDEYYEFTGFFGPLQGLTGKIIDDNIFVILPIQMRIHFGKYVSVIEETKKTSSQNVVDDFAFESFVFPDTGPLKAKYSWCKSYPGFNKIGEEEKNAIRCDTLIDTAKTEGVSDNDLRIIKMKILQELHVDVLKVYLKDFIFKVTRYENGKHEEIKSCP